jgi:hypothetical protein
MFVPILTVTLAILIYSTCAFAMYKYFSEK